MKYLVLRPHVGDKRYNKNDFRELAERDAKRLVTNGVLIDPKDVKPTINNLPDHWRDGTADELKELAKNFGGEGIATKKAAVEFIEGLLPAETQVPSPGHEYELAEQDAKWVILQNEQPVGEPFDTEEAARVALDELQKEAE